VIGLAYIMTGGVWEESWAPVTGRVASTIHAPLNLNANAPDNPAQIEQTEAIYPGER
jgi:hypothetical protein